MASINLSNGIRDTMLNNNKAMIDLPDPKICTIAILGLGYVGLPLAVEFSRTDKCLYSNRELSRKVIGFDVDVSRISELKNGYDRTGELLDEEIDLLSRVTLTADVVDLYKADVYIVTVPTPVDQYNRPDLSFLHDVSRLLGKVLRQRLSKNGKPIIIYESTVYPGATEEECIPIIECEAKSMLNKDFFCGYSPERVNPGDLSHKMGDIIKVTSGSNTDSAIWIDMLYKSIIKAGTYRAKSIKVAEAAKVIENTQRDLNIALVNELSMIFDKINIDTLDVIEAASTKWNFVKFVPGLVGGHCIGVDPYYLTYKAEQLGYHSEVVLAGRKINDSMHSWISHRIILELCKRKLNLSTSRILVLGLSFKENCPDLRNSKVFDLINELGNYAVTVEAYDPRVKKEVSFTKQGINIINNLSFCKRYSVVILAVAHNEFLNLREEDWRDLVSTEGFIFDLKGIVPRDVGPLRI